MANHAADGAEQQQTRPEDADSSEEALDSTTLRSGDRALDLVLGGGLPQGALYLLTGPPGAGKTILAQQISFSAAARGLRVIYFTNVSEPHAKLVQHIRNFSFYRPKLLGQQIQIYNITSQVRNKGLKETLDFIIESVRSEKADLVIVDSFRGLKHVLEIGIRDRGLLFDMAAKLSVLGSTTILVGEYTPLEIQTDPEFAIADGIITLTHSIDGLRDYRTLRVMKLRGVGYLGGEHRFTIGESGIHVYPRQEALTQAPRYRATQERITSGIADLDAMLHGGLIRSSSTLIAGSAGTGKTILSLHFLAAGAAQGERGLMISFQENPEQLRLRAASFGLDRYIDLSGGYTDILALSPVELNVDEAAERIREAVERRGVKRVVIDSVAEVEFAISTPDRFDDFLASLVGFLREREVTTVMTREITQLFGTSLSISSHGLSYIVDNIILLKYIELGAEIKRAITVIKTRGSDHDKQLRALLFNKDGVTVGSEFSGLFGLMTGIPRIASSADLEALRVQSDEETGAPGAGADTGDSGA